MLPLDKFFCLLDDFFHNFVCRFTFSAYDETHAWCFIEMGTSGAMAPFLLGTLALWTDAPSFADDHGDIGLTHGIGLPCVAHLPVDALTA